MKIYYEHADIVIYHGDCRENLECLTWGLFISDPPYGINLSSNGNHFSARSVRGDESQEIGEFAINIAHSRNAPIAVFADPLSPWSGKWKQHLVWDKGEAVGSGGDPKSCWRFDWELIQIANVARLTGGRQSSILRFPVRPFAPEYDFRFHPCQKPVALLEYLLRRIDDPGVICDPFMGSGSTLIAAKNLGRKAVGVEIEEKYCEAAASRLSQEVFEFA